MKFLKIALLLIFTSVFWISCIVKSTSKTQGPTADSIPVNVRDTAEILFRSGDTIITRETEKFCENGVLRTDVTNDTVVAQMVGANLEVWSPGDCAKLVYVGGTSVNDFWVTDFDTVSTMDPNCNNPGEISNIFRTFISPTASIDITDRQIITRYRGGVCFAEGALMGLAEDTAGMFEDEDVSMSIKNIRTQGCGTLAYDLIAGSAFLPISMEYNSYNSNNIGATINIGTCKQKIDLPIFFEDPTDCSLEQRSDSIMSETVGSCMFDYLYESNQIAEFFKGYEDFSAATVVSGRTLELYDSQLDILTTINFVKEGSDIILRQTINGCSFQITLNRDNPDDAVSEAEFDTCISNGSLLKFGKPKIPKLRIPIPKFN